jgi:Na+/proline symporter
MSTIDSYGFIAATTIGRDLIWRLRGERDERRLSAYSKAGLWVSAAFATALAAADPSVIGLWHDLGSITTPALLVPVTVALLGRGRLGPGWTLAAMVVPFAVSLLWVLAKAYPLPGRSPGYPWSIEPIYAGLGASLLTYGAGWAWRSTPRLTTSRGRPGAERDARGAEKDLQPRKGRTL